MSTSRQVQRLFRQGQRAVDAGDAAGGLRRYDQALALAPDFAPARLYRALGLGRMARHHEALAEADRAVALAPRRPAYHLFRGMVAYDAGENRTAADAFGEAHRLAPSNRLAAAYRHLTRIDQGRPEVDPARIEELKAELPYANAGFGARWLLCCEDELMHRYPQSRTLALQLIEETLIRPAMTGSARHRMTQGLARMGNAVALTPGRRRARRAARQGDACLAAGDLDGAIRRYAEALTYRPEWEPLQEKHLDLCLYRGAWEPLMERLSAFGDITRIEARPEAADEQTGLALLLAVVRYHQAERRIAERLFEAAVEADPLDYVAPYFLGLCRLARDDRQTAREWFQQALGLLNPDIVRRRLEEWQRCLSLP